MNIQKFTQKSMEAVSACEAEAYDWQPGNRTGHLLVALLQREGGLIPELITKMEINLDHFKGQRDQINGGADQGVGSRTGLYGQGSESGSDPCGGRGEGHGRRDTFQWGTSSLR